jgi:monoamine oxidase
MWNNLDPADLSREWYVPRLDRTTVELDQKHRSKKIAVIGAGMSGLVSAWVLGRAKHKVDVFEASNLPGGRIKTLRYPFTRGFYAEAGAMRIPDAHTVTMALIERLGLKPKLMEFQRADDNNLMYFNLVRHTRGEYQSGKHDFGFSTGMKPSELNRKAEHIFKECVLNYIDKCKDLEEWEPLVHKPGDCPHPPLTRSDKIFALIGDDTNSGRKIWNKLLMTEMDSFSLRHFLQDVARVWNEHAQSFEKLSPSCAAFVSAVLVYDMHYPSSMAAILGDYNELSGTKYWQIKGGMDRLPIALAKAAEDTENVTIHYNSRVRSMSSLERDNDKIRLVIENPISRFQRYLNDYDILIISIPFSALRHIDTSNLLSRQKKLAVRQLHYDNSCKILLEFSERFWETDCHITTGGSTITDLPVRQVHYPSFDQNRGRWDSGLLLASYTWGEDSLRWTSLRSDDRVRFALDDLQMLHYNSKQERDYLKAKCCGGFSHSWAEHEFTSGAFAMFEPTQFRELFPNIWRQEGRVHYCGEHTSTKHGWIEGAVEAGLRVATEVMDRVSSQDGFTARNTKPAGSFWA